MSHEVRITNAHSLTTLWDSDVWKLEEQAHLAMPKMQDQLPCEDLERNDKIGAKQRN
jgi:hypothetical protein